MPRDNQEQRNGASRNVQVIANLHSHLVRKFSMQVYCFPRPESPDQEGIIKALGSQENELHKIYLEMHDWEKLRVIIIICSRLLFFSCAGRHFSAAGRLVYEAPRLSN